MSFLQQDKRLRKTVTPGLFLPKIISSLSSFLPLYLYWISQLPFSHTFQEESLICKWECTTNQECLDKAETQVFQHCVTGGELQTYYRPCFKKDLPCRTLFFLWTLPCSHKLLNSQTLYTCVNSSRQLQVTG